MWRNAILARDPACQRMRAASRVGLRPSRVSHCRRRWPTSTPLRRSVSPTRRRDDIVEDAEAGAGFPHVRPFAEAERGRTLQSIEVRAGPLGDLSDVPTEELERHLAEPRERLGREKLFRRRPARRPGTPRPRPGGEVPFSDGRRSSRANLRLCSNRDGTWRASPFPWPFFPPITGVQASVSYTRLRNRSRLSYGDL